MNTSLILQYFIIALAVLASVYVVLKKQFPGTVRYLRKAVAQWLLRPQRSARIQALGRKLAPSVQLGNSCDGCHNCTAEGRKLH